MLSSPSLLLLLLSFAPLAFCGTVNHYAGSATGALGVGGDGGAPSSATFYLPKGIVYDACSSTMYISDQTGHQVRAISGGIVRRFAGKAIVSQGYGGDNGPATSATLNSPTGLAVGLDGSLYVAEILGLRVRKIDTAGVITTFAGTGGIGSSGDGGPPTSAKFNSPYSLVFSPNGLTLYVGDYSSCYIRAITANVISLFAGSGATCGNTGDGRAATSARIAGVAGMAFDSVGNMYVVGFSQWCNIRMINASGIITNVMGGPTSALPGGCQSDSVGKTAASTTANKPNGLVFDTSDNAYYAESETIRMITKSTGMVSLVAGTRDIAGNTGDGGAGTSAQLNSPIGVALVGNLLYFADSTNARVRTVNVGGSAPAQSCALRSASVSSSPSLAPTPSLSQSLAPTISGSPSNGATGTASPSQAASYSTTRSIAATPLATPSRTRSSVATPSISPSPLPDDLSYQAGAPWPCAHGNNASSGVSPFSASTSAGPLPMHLAWSFLSPLAAAAIDPVAIAPIIGADGAIRMALQNNAGQGYIITVTPGGGQAASWSVGQFGVVVLSHCSPAIGFDGTLYMGDSATGNLHALAPTGGAPLWNFPGAGPTYASPIIGRDNTVFWASANFMNALNGRTGSRMWFFDVNNQILVDSVLSPDGAILYVAGWASPIVALDASNGAVVIAAVGGVMSGGWKYSALALGPNNTMYVGADDFYIYAFDRTRSAGGAMWRFRTNGYVTASPVVGNNGLLYAASYDSFVYALDAKSGALVWKSKTAAPILSGTPVLSADGTLFVGGGDKWFYAFNATNGTPLWNWTLGTAQLTKLSNPASIGADGTVYTIGSTGALYAFNTLPCASGTTLLKNAAGSALCAVAPTPSPTASIAPSPRSPSAPPAMTASTTATPPATISASSVDSSSPSPSQTVSSTETTVPGGSSPPSATPLSPPSGITWSPSVSSAPAGASLLTGSPAPGGGASMTSSAVPAGGGLSASPTSLISQSSQPSSLASALASASANAANVGATNAYSASSSATATASASASAFMASGAGGGTSGPGGAGGSSVAASSTSSESPSTSPSIPTTAASSGGGALSGGGSSSSRSASPLSRGSGGIGFQTTPSPLGAWGNNSQRNSSSATNVDQGVAVEGGVEDVAAKTSTIILVVKIVVPILFLLACLAVAICLFCYGKLVCCCCCCVACCGGVCGCRRAPDETKIVIISAQPPAVIGVLVPPLDGAAINNHLKKKRGEDFDPLSVDSLQSDAGGTDGAQFALINPLASVVTATAFKKRASMVGSSAVTTAGGATAPTKTVAGYATVASSGAAAAVATPPIGRQAMTANPVVPARTLKASLGASAGGEEDDGFPAAGGEEHDRKDGEDPDLVAAGGLMPANALKNRPPALDSKSSPRPSLHKKQFGGVRSRMADNVDDDDDIIGGEERRDMAMQIEALQLAVGRSADNKDDDNENL